MKKVILVFISIFMLAGVLPAADQSVQDEIDESNRQFREWAASISEFVKDVRFNEQDVQSLLSLWGDFNAVGEEQVTEKEEEEEFMDFDSILKNSTYRSWAQSNGLNSEKWLKKSMRIMAMIMRTQLEEGMSEGQFDLEQQLAELEKMREQMGEEMYQQMKQAMEAGAAAMQGVDSSYKLLPVPTGPEKLLLAKYNDQLIHLE